MHFFNVVDGHNVVKMRLFFKMKERFNLYNNVLNSYCLFFVSIIGLGGCFHTFPPNIDCRLMHWR